MSNAQANLKVNIGADIAEIKSALTQLRGTINKTKTDAAGIDFKGITASMKGLLAGTAAFSAFAFGIKNAIDSADQLGEAAEKIGISTEALSELAYAAKLSAVDQDVLQKALAKLSVDLTKQDSLLRQLGVTATTADGALLQLANIFRNMPDGVEKTAAAAKIFGERIGPDLVPLLNRGAEGIEELRRRARELGITLSSETAQKAGEFNDSMDDIRFVVDASFRSIAADLIPAMTDLARYMAGPEFRQGFGAVISGLGQIIDQSIRGVTALGGLGLAIKDALTTDVNKTYEGLLTQRNRLVEDMALIERGGITANPLLLSGGQSGKASPLRSAKENIAILDAEITKIDELINARRAANNQNALAAKIAGTVNMPPAAPTTSLSTILGGDDADAKRKSAAAEAERKRKAEQEVRDAEARQKRIAQGMLDVNNVILTQTGEEFEAARAEIQQKYAQLLADLEEEGRTAEILDVKKAMRLEEAAAQLDIFKDKVSQINAELRQEEGNIADQVTAGVISQLEAERQINDARDVALAKMRQLQDAAAAYLAKLDPNSPEGQRALEFYRQLGLEIQKVSKTQNKLAQETRDIAENAFADLFADLITGAKSAKDAFQDFVRSFVQGIARMIAQRLAQIVVERLFQAIIGGGSGASKTKTGGNTKAGFYHTGGLVGFGGVTKNVDPALFFNAPRYHTGGIAGLRPNEVPAILERGEMVIPKGAVGRGGGGNVSVIVENNSGAQARTEESMQGQDKIIRVIIDAAKSAIAGDIARGGTTINKAMEGRYGVNPQGVARG